MASENFIVNDLVFEKNDLVFETNVDTSGTGWLKGPRGDKGDKGDKGDTGAKGDKGDTGNSPIVFGEAEPTDPEAGVWFNQTGEGLTGNNIPMEEGDTLGEQLADIRDGTESAISAAVAPVTSQLADKVNKTHERYAGDCNNITDPGTYATLNATNTPDSGVTSFFVRHDSYSFNTQTWYVQTAIPSNNRKKVYRRDQKGGTWSAWVEAENLDQFVNATLFVGDLDALITIGDYVISTDASNKPVAEYGMLEVRKHASGNLTYITHRYTGATTAREYSRFKYNTSAFTAWKQIDRFGADLTGSNIAVFGTSIEGNIFDSTGVCNQLSLRTGATVHNFALGGTRAVTGSGAAGIQPFALCSLVDAVTSGVWTSQDSAISEYGGTLPYYFPARLAALKAMDFTTVKIALFSFGTNDYTGGVGIENELNLKDTTYYAGALRHSIETLLMQYPNIRIVIVTPMWRCWLDESDNYAFLYDSDTNEISGQKLTDFVEKAVSVANEYHIRCLDMYNGVGINKFTRLSFFDVNDGTHHNAAGRAFIGGKIGWDIMDIAK